MTKEQLMKFAKENECSDFINFCSDLRLDPTDKETFECYMGLTMLSCKFIDVLKKSRKTSGRLSVDLKNKSTIVFLEDGKTIEVWFRGN